ncbi:MAG: hypothetical protein KAV00_15820 [Phycisphaerae bacterium]|nr:hypothetical protein [Phycisphaerae bacterium]
MVSGCGIRHKAVDHQPTDGLEVHRQDSGSEDKEYRPDERYVYAGRLPGLPFGAVQEPGSPIM